MRMPRFRVRTLMVLVGIVAWLMWGLNMGTRSYDYYRRASYYRTQEDGWRAIAARGRFRTEFSSECAEYFAKLTQKYRRAVWHPWIHVAPDPHAPGFDQWLEQESRAKDVQPEPAASEVRESKINEIGIERTIEK